MTITLPPDLMRLVDERMRQGGYSSPDDVLRAALEQLRFNDPAEPDADRLIAAGLDSLRAGRTQDGEAVFARLLRE